MHLEETTVPGVLVVTPRRHVDERGDFYEGMRVDALERALGHPFAARQINYSTSRKNTLRGIHGVAIPPGQAKYVTCVQGALRDIVVDLRVGSPAYGRHHVTELDAESGRSVYVPEGVGHGFLTRDDDTRICYVLSSTYVPGTQIDIDPLDHELALPWGFTHPPLMSDKDAAALSLAEAVSAGLLPRWERPGVAYSIRQE
ncbi:dTDP-4-dehydrorhamnose 3,5-epimerase [Streptomyces abyssalis]|uniref:dTDP-4-dehydrorhamnose 3,5-epimerase n=1 Tax=Streptomyces abyssalis TaxID=933944 RepID=A0A1E7JIP9_9ACTN|nr:dTDP-4-dehydrorhamnose 3,5-epimerase family protein [Streptomyces abyssalis]OEU86332.1 dTDP-4-dehydrorhamnose 3,5-epimerase [Streptomyces abyssalis]OEU93317.1 dTDP-4-dehydrorhamnose 3,5-epimerase [Streptomyces abyssalis]OEV30544.1 dTDP-4-dehydrorhamnose 3,5-epimerase [Streptomyces nanshensis]